MTYTDQSDDAQNLTAALLVTIHENNQYDNRVVAVALGRWSAHLRREVQISNIT
jgi:hypothetical protein